MIVIDGSQGEGGGQVLRTSLALSMITGEPVVFENIRAGRAKPGLMRQHLTCALAAAEVCNARLEGAELRSMRLSFTPGEVVPGDYTFRVGTAGSTGLVLQTVLPALMLAATPSTLTVEGGTHNSRSPSYDFLARTFAPALARFGPRLDLELEVHGFYPVGGGRVRATITPTPREALQHVELLTRGELKSRRAVALGSRLPASVTTRELAEVQRLTGWDDDDLTALTVDSPGPGNALWTELIHGDHAEVFTSFGAKGKPSEEVAHEVVEQTRAFLASGAVISDDLANQLMIPLALHGAGALLAMPPSLHTQTQAEIISRFLPHVSFTLDRDEDATRAWVIRAAPIPPAPLPQQS